MNLSIIIPVFNEEKRLPKTLRDVVDFLFNQKINSEIIIVDDGSTDHTVEIVKKFIEDFPYIRLIENNSNHGKGYVVRQGMLQASGEKRLFMDADGSTPISEAVKLIKYIDDGYDIAIGSRRVVGSKVKEDQPVYRIFLGWIFRNLINFILPLNVVDSQNGFKIFRKKTIEKLFAKQKINGWAFDVEILYLARKNNFKIVEVPIVWVNDKESRVTLKGMIKMLFEVIKIRKNSKI